MNTKNTAGLNKIMLTVKQLHGHKSKNTNTNINNQLQ